MMKDSLRIAQRIGRGCLAVLVLSVPVFTAHAGPVPANLGNGLQSVYSDHIARQLSLPASAERTANAEAAAAYLASAVQDASGRIHVTIHLNGDLPLATVVDSLGASKKFEVTGKSDKYRAGVVDGWMQIQDTASIAKLRGVSSVILSTKPVTNVGATTQQGVVQHRVNQVSQNGTGITVAALSDSYNVSTSTIKAANDIASGDLPGAGNPLGNTTPVVVLQDDTTGSDEGRAMLQLIHDMAPKARLGFATSGASQLQFADNIRSLAALPGAPRTVPGFKADIIVDDIIFFAEPMFSDGVVAQAVNDVTAAGVHYFSSAGNRASTSAYASNLRIIAANDNPTAGTNINLTGVDPALYAGGFHNFRTDGTRDIAQTLARTAGVGPVTPNASRLVLQWDDPFDKVSPGTSIFNQSANFTGTPATLDYFVPLTAGVPTRIAVTAAAGSAFDAIVTVTDPSNNIVINALDTGTDETVFITPTATGNYKITIAAFGGTTGNFSVEVFSNSGVGITTDINVLFFNPTTGAFISSTSVNNLQTNQAVEISSIPIPAGLSTVQMVITRGNTPVGTAASRLRYVIFDSSAAVVPVEYFSYQYPVIYGHNSARDGHGVAAYSAFRPYIPEGFTSPGPSTILFDTAGNRLASPEVRQKPDIAGMDGGNTTFFVSDSPSDADTFPNFFGTSAAAPNVASIAALVLQAYGGPGSLSVQQMKTILQRSAYAHDLDPNFSRAIINTGSGTLTITVNADPSGTSSGITTTGVIDPNVINVSYTGSGSIATLAFNMTGGNTTGGNENTVIPGLAFDTRAVASGGAPFTLGTLNGLTAGDITPSFSTQPPAPSLAGQFSNLGLTFGSGTFTGGKSFAFTVDRDEQTISNLTTPATAGGNSADLWGATVSMPSGVVSPGGVTVSGTMTDGTPFSGVFLNNIGAGYSPLDGYGFVNAQLAVNTGPRNALDLSGDSRADIVYTDASGVVGGLLMNGVTPFSTSTILAAGTGWTVSHIAEVDGDGKADLIIRNTDGRAAILVMNGLNVTSFTPLVGAGQGWTVTQAVDLDGNGKADFVLKNTDGRVAILLMNGTTIVSFTQLFPAGSPYTPIFAGDFDGDGKADLLFKHTDGSVAIVLMNGASGVSAGQLLGAGSPWSVSHVADLNGDGKADIIIKNTDGSAAMLLVNGTVVTRADFLLGAGSPYSVTHTGDFNGDGKADILLRNTDGSIVLLQMNGTTVAAASFLVLAGSTLQVAQVADYNGDGKSDILLKNTDGSTIAVLMDGGAVTAAGSAWGAGSRRVVP